MDWINIKDKKPKYTKSPDSMGTPVIVFHEGGVKQAYYGVRITAGPNFYLHGAVMQVEWWLPMPVAPGQQPPEKGKLPWRVGHSVSNNVYDANDEQIAVFFRGEHARLAVGAVNELTSGKRGK